MEEGTGDGGRVYRVGDSIEYIRQYVFEFQQQLVKLAPIELETWELRLPNCVSHTMTLFLLNTMEKSTIPKPFTFSMYGNMRDQKSATVLRRSRVHLQNFHFVPTTIRCSVLYSGTH